MKISIIIPIYNSDRFLKECLDSVQAQDFEDWECLLIDDGSIDNSGVICDFYAKQDSRFKVFHIENSGVSAARNLGINYASGRYITFIDSDDTVDKTYLSTFYKATTLSEAELIVCGIKYVRAFGASINSLANGLVVIGEKDADRFVQLNRKFLIYGPVNKLYKASIIKNNRINFPSGIQYGEDLVFNFEYLEYVTSIWVIDSPGYNYRILSGGSLSTSAQSRNFNINYGQWKIIRAFFDKKNINTPDARTYLSNRLWGIAYNSVMSNQLSIKDIRDAFCGEFVNDLQTFNTYTIPIPMWLKTIMINRLYGLMWLVQYKIRII